MVEATAQKTRQYEGMFILDANPIHVLCIENADAIPVAHSQPGQIVSLLGQALQQRP